MHRLLQTHLVLLTSLLAGASLASAQTKSITLTTYYTSPFGSYDRIALIPRGAIADADCGPQTAGTIYANNEEPLLHRIFFCGRDITGSFRWLPLPGVWQQGKTASGENAVFLDNTTVDFIGIGTNDPLARLHLHNGAFLADGTIGSTPVTGPGTRLMWVPDKSAFRAGYVTGTQWNDANIGQASAAIGYDALASNIASMAFGYRTRATGESSTAISGFNTAGNFTTASGTSSTAIGGNATASGGASTAIGSSVTASGTASTAIGTTTTASGHFSTAIGLCSTANAPYALSIGRDVLASAEQSLTIGKGLNASNKITNTISNSLIIGFNPNSVIPTLFISAAHTGIHRMDPTSSLSISGNVSVGAYAASIAPATEGMIISGSVGIGTDDPSTALDINGAVRTRPTPLPPDCPGPDDIRGAIIYSSTLNVFQGCTNIGWRTLKFN